jgi:hypothetical protein
MTPGHWAVATGTGAPFSGTGHSLFGENNMFSNQSSRAMSECSMREDSNSPKSQVTHALHFSMQPIYFQIGTLSNSGQFFEEEDY